MKLTKAVGIDVVPMGTKASRFRRFFLGRKRHNSVVECSRYKSVFKCSRTGENRTRQSSYLLTFFSGVQGNFEHARTWASPCGGCRTPSRIVATKDDYQFDCSTCISIASSHHYGRGRGEGCR